MNAVHSHFGLCLERMFSGHIPWVVFKQSSAGALKSEGPGLQNGECLVVSPLPYLRGKIQRLSRMKKEKT